MLDAAYYAARGLSSIYKKILNRKRLDFDDGMTLFACPDITALGSLAHEVRTKFHDLKTHYVVNRQINYTNVCVNDCVFCAFRRDNVSEPGAFLLDKTAILRRVDEACQGSPGLDELHIVGGCHPDLPLSFFEDVFEEIGSRWPGLPIKAFTPVEIAHFAKKESLSPKQVLVRLQKSGLAMLPGGGAEIFDEKLRSVLCPSKANAAEWLEISGTAHKLGIKSNCTMLYGHVENAAQRVDHLLRLRDQQDKTGGFTCFIPLRFLTSNNRLKLPHGGANALESLKVIAISRLLLDNIEHIKAYWIMLGQKLAQTALWYGANDLDGTIVEEHIGHMAGSKTSQGLTINELEEMIRESGFEPVRRNALFASV